MSKELMNKFNNQIYAVCSALVTADNREDVAAAMSGFYALISEVYDRGKADGRAAISA